METRIGSPDQIRIKVPASSKGFCTFNSPRSPPGLWLLALPCGPTSFSADVRLLSYGARGSYYSVLVISFMRYQTYSATAGTQNFGCLGCTSSSHYFNGVGGYYSPPPHIYFASLPSLPLRLAPLLEQDPDVPPFVLVTLLPASRILLHHTSARCKVGNLRCCI